MGREERLYPLSEEKFTETVLPIIQASYRGKGRPPEVSHYKVFCGILYILRTGCPWRDLPEEYGYWHVVYDRFSRGSERRLWAKILVELQKAEGIRFPEVIIDSTTMKVHRHGGRQKGAADERGIESRDEHEIPPGDNDWGRSGGRVFKRRERERHPGGA